MCSAFSKWRTVMRAELVSELQELKKAIPFEQYDAAGLAKRLSSIGSS
jgi:hypothetical protein